MTFTCTCYLGVSRYRGHQGKPELFPVMEKSGNFREISLKSWTIKSENFIGSKSKSHDLTGMIGYSVSNTSLNFKTPIREKLRKNHCYHEILGTLNVHVTSSPCR